MGLAERLGRRRKSRYGCCDQRPDAGHRHEPSGDVIFFGVSGNPSIEFRDLRFELSQCPDQDLQCGRRLGGQPGLRITYDGNQLRCIDRPPATPSA